MSMLKHRDEFSDLYKQSGEVFEPSKQTQESDDLGITYTNCPCKADMGGKEE